MLLSAVSLMAKVDSCKGPYMMTQNVSVPSGCSKVIVDSSSSMINGAITLKMNQQVKSLVCLEVQRMYRLGIML